MNRFNKSPLFTLELSLSWRDTAITILVLLATTILCFFLRELSTGDTYVSMIFVMAVVLIARMTNGYLYGLLASAIAVVGVNYAFTRPYFAFNLSLSGYPLTFGCMLAVSIIVSTLTTRLKQSEKERYARQTEEMRANLLRAISHDLRTPLTSIQGAATILSEQLDEMSVPRRSALLKQITDDAEWLIRMVENLLSVTRINAGETRIHKRIEAAEEIIAEAVRKFRARVPGLPVEIHLPDELLLVPMDPILIEQVITNLLENAAYHAQNASHVVIQLSQTDDQAIFDVIDDGKGIDATILPTIFTGMYKSSSPSSDTTKNIGIGLNVCQTIINAHGGVMTAGNRPEGGARMRFTLPIKEESHDPENQHPDR